MKSIISFYLLLFSIALAAQNYPSGVIMDDVEDKAFEQAYRADFFGAKSDNLPLKVSLRKWAPKPRIQGDIASCVGFSCSNAMSIMLAMQDSLTSEEQRNKNVHSALYIYNQTNPHGCMGGSRIYDAVELLKEKGNCFARQFDNPIEDCGRQPESEHHRTAANYKIKDYLAVFDLSHSEERIIHLIKQELADNKPVIIGMQVTQSIFLMKKGDKIWNPKLANPNPTGGHSVCVTGYNDYNQTFEILNSWGEDWADNGFFYARYEDLAKYARYGYTLVLENKDKEDSFNFKLKGDFAFRSPVRYDVEQNHPVFEEITPDFDGKKYVLNNWKSINVYQLVGTGMKKDSYVYVFSIDARNKAELNFPKELDINKNTGFLTKPIVPDESAQIIIPDRFAALQSVHPGTDHLCVLYSTTEIKNIVERIFEVKHAEDTDFTDRLQQGFGDLLVPPENITYSKDYMGFTATSGEGSVVPIVLDIIVY